MKAECTLKEWIAHRHGFEPTDAQRISVDAKMWEHCEKHPDHFEMNDEGQPIQSIADWDEQAAMNLIGDAL